MVWYVSKHKREHNLATFGKLWNGFSILNAFRAFWDSTGAFATLERLGIIIWYVSKHRHNTTWGCFGNVRKCLGTFWERVEASGNVSERFGAS